MKKLLLLIFIFLSASVLAQEKKRANDDLYNALPQEKFRDLTFTNDIDKMQYCLGKYRRERQIGYMNAGIGAAALGIYFGQINNDLPNLAKTTIVMSVIFEISSVIIFIDAEKWLKRASISISPTALIINF
ncbi:MAG TPA: hypothetical protein VMV77_04780 [Bacteroidales bacterium]|nr:hypothetical protein [Bacteroidales bacterium]